MSESGGPLEVRLHRLWSGQGSPMLRGVLYAAAGAYRGALAAREACYGAGVLSTRRLPVPVISIGNLTLGGSGKTPLAALVAGMLRDLGARPAIISRGYGRRTRGVLVVADSDGVRLTAREAGDEPRLLAEQLAGTPVVVGESRYEAGKTAVEGCGANVLVLDDGFQHRTLAKDLEILAVEGSEPWGNGRLFPRGVLREPLSALRRAHLVVVTNPAAQAAVARITWSLRQHGSHADVLAGFYRAESLRAGDSPPQSPAALSGRRVVALAGLASPASLVRTLTSLGAEVVELLAFPDHYSYGEADLERVRQSARRTGTDWIVTTEKDWMRLREAPRLGIDLHVLSIRLDMGADRRRLWEGLAEALGGRATGRTSS
jgi:tetraacyldisaccharide 4'-kinase